MTDEDFQRIKDFVAWMKDNGVSIAVRKSHRGYGQLTNYDKLAVAYRRSLESGNPPSWMKDKR